MKVFDVLSTMNPDALTSIEFADFSEPIVFDEVCKVKLNPKGSWDTHVDEATLEGMIGSALENAIWEEFGTGEYALNGDGRKGGWAYTDRKGETHFTHGKKPNRALWNAFQTLKPKLIKRAEALMKELNGND